MKTLLSTIERYADLTPEEREAVEALRQAPLVRVPARQTTLSEGDTPGVVRLLAQGWAYRFKDLPDGRRQIVGLLLPGDFFDLGVRVVDEMDHSVAALTPITYYAILPETLERLGENHPRIAQALARHDSVNAAIHREWLLNLGRRNAFERLAHLFLEIFLRLRAAGLAQSRECDCPLTQNDLADATGVTSVHLNRTMQELRREGLVELRSKRLYIRDYDRLSQVAMFNRNYLRIGREAWTDAR
ncbi:Crp/Fnr family transcriptional regulator [Erythrobacter sp. HL-111]|uniref:Crp/Fnr family transcriptional regulator n=1 Tax=Erythrobacter sp. HL-111 TaxID=1798193 RepID=UPI0006DB7068|nr:Crp/Fnr family transcriptional regulator [Erythrobacter sp. HL-111]KPP92202.1 MAG: cAMP-binding putative transcriptional regulator [Erythrobacteraceae bacterium HL-111]SDS39601.1 cAMP-binding domain of CRP or a regulatory subunit of cAMP-dependent protein kinases [Erythrobacter sp. HL-111]